MSKQQKHADFLQVLEYYDGPQAVLLQKSNDVKIVAVAVDDDDDNDKFFGSSISYDQWERYRRGYVDFRSLFMYPRWKEWYLFNLKYDQDSKVIIGLPLNNRDKYEEFIPGSGFFAYDHSENILVGVHNNVATQKYNTDGVWALPDFTQFYNKLNDLYSFFFALKTFSGGNLTADKKRKIKESFLGHPLRGGSSYNNLYSDLASIQSFDDKIAIGRLQYASPGKVDVRGRFDVFTEIAVAYNELNNDYDNLKLKYNELHKYLQEHGLLRHAERLDVSGPIADYILKKSKELANDLHLTDSQLILDLTEKNPLIFAKIILSYFRRLERYFMFFAEGRVKQPELLKDGNIEN